MEILINRMASADNQKTFFTDRVMEELHACGNVREGVFTRDELRDALPGVDILFGSWGLPRKKASTPLFVRINDASSHR